MAQIREIKCKHCGQWTMWNGDVDDRCLYCNEFLERDRFTVGIETRINADLLRESDLFFIKPGDGILMRVCKKTLNSLRWAAFYGFMGFVILAILLLLLVSILVI